MSDEHATVLYKGHRYQRRKVDKASCAGCVFKSAGANCDCPITPEFGICGAVCYRWVEVDEQGDELNPSTLTDNKGRVTNIKTGVRYTVAFIDDRGELRVQPGMYQPSRDDSYLQSCHTCVRCCASLTIALDNRVCPCRHPRVEAVYTDEEFAKLIGMSL